MFFALNPFPQMEMVQVFQVQGPDMEKKVTGILWLDINPVHPDWVLFPKGFRLSLNNLVWAISYVPHTRRKK